jgi:FtsP/CotA-like multicopper oxidase with cupredoxin domain
MSKLDINKLSRRQMIRLGLLSGAAMFGPRLTWAQQCSGFIDQTPQDIDLVTGLTANEVFPTSPFILNPFTDPLPIPEAMLPGYRQPDGTLTPSAPDAWMVRTSAFGSNRVLPPSPLQGRQDAMGARARTAGVPGPAVPDAGTHQLWTDGSGVSGTGSGIRVPGFPLPNPNLYHIRLQVGTHDFTTSKVAPITSGGAVAPLPPGASDQGGFIVSAGFDPVWGPTYKLPSSTIYGFNGSFPGPRINAMYGQPNLVRFENDLDLNPLCRNRQDFGAPDWAFLTHLHNGHTAPESDGQPHHLTDNKGGYIPSQWVDDLYLNYPAGNDPAEKQSFLWFHDHRMHHTGANVYKGMVGLYPIYDPILDPGDETNTKGLRLPGRKRIDPRDPTGQTFNVDYDIPMALYDTCLDDGITGHQDFHNGTGELHPEWWGKTYFRHFPNHGFVGDVFTINGTAFPVLNVYRRKYRFRFLGASVSRIYELMLMRGTPTAAPGIQGQYQIPDGQQCHQFTQIASEGGLLPKPITRDSFQIWPAKRKEVVVDFTKYMDGSPTTPGDVLYLVDVLDMPDGRKPNFNVTGGALTYKVPMMKIVIGGAPPEQDVSNIPNNLRPMPVLPKNKTGLPQRTFTLERSGTAGGETQWIINGLEFNPLSPLALPQRSGAGEVWTVANGGGGWVHPMHMHQEEHTTLARVGSTNPHPDDTGKEDVVALDPSESVQFFRRFRTFAGNYVAHCHNLAHEDHNMMFGWSIVP